MTEPTIAKVLLGLVNDVAERLREAHLAGHLEHADLQEARAAFAKALEGGDATESAAKQQNGVEASSSDKPDDDGDDRKPAVTPIPPQKEPEVGTTIDGAIAMVWALVLAAQNAADALMSVSC